MKVPILQHSRLHINNWCKHLSHWYCVFLITSDYWQISFANFVFYWVSSSRTHFIFFDIFLQSLQTFYCFTGVLCIVKSQELRALTRKLNRHRGCRTDLWDKTAWGHSQKWDEWSKPGSVMETEMEKEGRNGTVRGEREMSLQVPPTVAR